MAIKFLDPTRGGQKDEYGFTNPDVISSSIGDITVAITQNGEVAINGVRMSKILQTGTKVGIYNSKFFIQQGSSFLTFQQFFGNKLPPSDRFMEEHELEVLTTKDAVYDIYTH